ncbi:MAG: sodium:solute symporter family protein [Pseudomonadota bacterium]
MNLVLACILIYIVSQLAVAFWVSHRNRNEEDYLLAGRALGPWLATFSVFATWFGAETCIGAAGEAYQHGLSGVIADPFGYTLGIVFMGLFFAATLWKRGIVTLADLFQQRYSLGVARLAAVIMIPGSVLWAAAQVRAFGQVLSSASELGLFTAITLAAVVVIAYTAIGGMWANATTDLIQGLVLIAGVLGLFAVFVSIGGLTTLANLPPAKTEVLHERTVWDALDTLAIPIFSTIAAQELVARVLSMRGAQLARNATVGAGLLYLLIGSVPVMIGLGAASFIGTDRDHEQVLALFAQENLPLPLYILFLGALVSAILSTLAGALLVAASLAAHNLYAPLRPGLSETQKISASRWAVVLFGIVAYGIALSSDSVYALVQEAGGLGSSGILVAMLFALWGQRFGGAFSGYASLIVGTGTYVVAKHLLGYEQPYLLSLAASLLAYLALSPALFKSRTAP